MSINCRLSSLLQQVHENDLKIGSSCIVKVTYIKGPQSFYVRPSTYSKFLPELQEHEDLLNSYELHLYKLVIFHSKKCNDFIRGQIMNILDDDEIVCDLYAVDYGFLEKSVPLTNMYKPAHELQIPSLAIHCQLANCMPLENDTFNENVCDAMKLFVGNEVAKIIVRDITADKFFVELYNSCPDDIATMLAYSGHTTYGFGASSAAGNSHCSTVTHNSFKFKTLEVGDTLRVRVQSGETLNSFFVAEVNDYKKYLEERNEYTAYARREKPLEKNEIRLEQPVGLFNDDYMKYDRTIIKNFSDDDEKVLVQLADWGIFKESYISNLRKLPETYLVHPAVAIYCSADERQAWDNRLHKFLYPGFEFQITVKQTGFKFVHPNFVDIAPINNYY